MGLSQQVAMRAIGPLQIPAFKDHHICYEYGNNAAARGAQKLLAEKFNAHFLNRRPPPSYPVPDETMRPGPRMGTCLIQAAKAPALLGISYNNSETYDLIVATLGRPDFKLD